MKPATLADWAVIKVQHWVFGFVESEFGIIFTVRGCHFQKKDVVVSSHVIETQNFLTSCECHIKKELKIEEVNYRK